jgi:hexosaminidase
MRLQLLAGVMFAAAPLPGQAVPVHTLMPVPASVTMSDAVLRFDSTLTISLAHYRDPRLERATGRAVVRLEQRLGAPLSRQHGSGEAGTIVIDVAAAGNAIPQLGDDESYQLKVTATGAVLTAPTVVGAIRGLETLLQLQGADDHGLYFSGATIDDRPRFRWRGLLLDVSRHFEPVEVVKRTLDGMAMVKLNVLHWHLADDQGFRVESRIYPRLQQLGSDSLFYTQAQIRDVVAYAADRGIRVMPEFDMAGHSSSWFPGYPDLTVGAGPFEIARTWGVFYPTMDPTRESTYKFIDAFIGEIAALFPDRYWHIGGDEVNAKQWHETPAIQAWMNAHGIATEVALQTAFNQRLFAMVQKHGKIPVGWDEILQPDLPTSAVIQSWRSTTALAASAKAGFRGILSAPFYIDHTKPASDFYTPDPLPATTDLTPTQQELVLGGEACMWGEYVNPEIIDSRIWPRLAVIAERFWSPATVTDIANMYRRLGPTSRRLSELGIHADDHSQRMVQRLTADSADLLTTLLGYVRPPDFGGNGPNQFYPHSRLIDAAVPDPRVMWGITDEARRAAAGDDMAAAAMRKAFVEMMGLRARLIAAGPQVPALAAALPVADPLADLGRVGLEALGYVARKEVPPASWRAGADSLLAAIVKRRVFGGLRPVATDAVRVLVEGTRALPPPRGTP